MFHYSILNKENCRRSSSGNSYRMVGIDWACESRCNGSCCLDRQTSRFGYRLSRPISGSSGPPLPCHALSPSTVRTGRRGRLVQSKHELGHRWAGLFTGGKGTFRGLTSVRAVRRRHFVRRHRRFRRRTIFSKENGRFRFGAGIAICRVIGRRQPSASQWRSL